MVPYVIRSGDFLRRLSHTMGFDADAVWKEAKNDGLRSLRRNPNILLPGDILFVPDPAPQKWTRISVGSHTRFVAKATPVVRVSVIFKHAGKTLSNAPCVIHGLGSVRRRKTDEKGQLVFDAPVTTEFADVVFTELGFHQRLKIGHLDPSTEVSGIRQRLQNLGYVRQPNADDTADLSGAIERYQRDNKLAVTSAVDADLVQHLMGAHGC